MIEFQRFAVIVILRTMSFLLLCAVPAFGQSPFDIRAIMQRAQANLDSQIRAASVQVQHTVAEVPKITDSKIQPTVEPEVKIIPVPIATKEQKDSLIRLITAFASRVGGSQTRYSAAATTALFAGCALALIASILSFLRINTAAGIVGLAVAALTALPTAYPINSLASFYRTLSAQSTALLYDCSLREPMTMDAFNSASNQLQLLVVYEGEKFPQFGSTGDVSGQLVKELQSLKIVNPSSNVAVEKR